MNEAEAHRVVAATLRQIAPEIDLKSVDATAPLREELDIDSMDFLNLVVGVHEATGIDIPEHDYPRVATLHDMVAYLVTHSA